MSPGGHEVPRGARLSALAVAVVAILGLLYIVSQFLRNSVGVIAPNLAAEVGLSPIEIGLLSSIYFFCFAATQLPLGVALDRFGPKRCMLVSIAVTVAGSTAFALAHDVSGLVVSRALLGFGTACFLMAPVALYARWFPPERFSTLAGIHLGVGSLGALLATAPLAFTAATFGWRAAFLGIAIITVVIGLLTWLVVSDDPPGQTTEPHQETLRESIAGIWQVIRTPSIGRVFLVQLTSYPSFVLVVGLWGGPYLTHIYGYDLKGRGEILFVAALAQVLGSFFWGPSDRMFGRFKPPILFGTALSFSALLLFALGGVMPVPLLLARVCAARLLHRHDLGGDVARPFAGAAAPAGALHHAPEHRHHGRRLSRPVRQRRRDRPVSESGRRYPLEAYRLVFGLQAALVLVGAWAYFGSQEKGLTR